MQTGEKTSKVFQTSLPTRTYPYAEPADNGLWLQGSETLPELKGSLKEQKGKTQPTGEIPGMSRGFSALLLPSSGRSQVSPPSAITETPSKRQEREDAFYEFIPSRNQALLREKHTSPDGPQPSLEVRLEAKVQALSLSLLQDRGCSHGLWLGRKDSRNPGTQAQAGNSSALLPARDLLPVPSGQRRSWSQFSKKRID